jgi:hypothetical protein
MDKNEKKIRNLAFVPLSNKLFVCLDDEGIKNKIGKKKRVP